MLRMYNSVCEYLGHRQTWGLNIMQYHAISTWISILYLRHHSKNPIVLGKNLVPLPLHLFTEKNPWSVETLGLHTRYPRSTKRGSTSSDKVPLMALNLTSNRQFHQLRLWTLHRQFHPIHDKRHQKHPTTGGCWEEWDFWSINSDIKSTWHWLKTISEKIKWMTWYSWYSHSHAQMMP